MTQGTKSRLYLLLLPEDENIKRFYELNREMLDFLFALSNSFLKAINIYDVASLSSKIQFSVYKTLLFYFSCKM